MDLKFKRLFEEDEEEEVFKIHFGISNILQNVSF